MSVSPYLNVCSVTIASISRHFISVPINIGLSKHTVKTLSTVALVVCSLTKTLPKTLTSTVTIFTFVSTLHLLFHYLRSSLPNFLDLRT
jgi:hypothetical protein